MPGLHTPGGKGGVHKGVHPVHGGLQGQHGAVRQPQLDDDAAAGDHIELLAHNLPEAMLLGFAPEAAHQKAVAVIKNAEAEIVNRQPQPHEQHNDAGVGE